MSLTIRHETIGDVEVLVLIGDVDMSSLPRLTDALNRADLTGRATVAVDVDQVTVLDDAALGIVIGAAAHLRRAGRRLVLVCSNDRLIERIDFLGLTEVLAMGRSLSALPGHAER